MSSNIGYVGWSKERGFYYDPDGPYVRRSDFEFVVGEYGNVKSGFASLERERRDANAHCLELLDTKDRLTSKSDQLLDDLQTTGQELIEMHEQIKGLTTSTEELTWVLNRAEEIVSFEHGKVAASAFEQAWGELPVKKEE